MVRKLQNLKVISPWNKESNAKIQIINIDGLKITKKQADKETDG